MTAEGMFLYAKLVMQNLFNSVNREDLYAEIDPETLPKGIDQAYDRIARRIFNNPAMSPSRQNAIAKLLGLIVCAKRPMMWHEIQGAVAIGADDGSFDYENRQLLDSANELCGSLVDEHACGTVELVHATARQYLLKDYLKDEEVESRMALLCVGYLAMECFNADATDDEIRQFIFGAYYAFHDYAVAHWIDHLRAYIQHVDEPHIDPELLELVHVFFANQWRDSYKSVARIPKSMKTAFRALDGYDFHDQLLQVHYFRETDATGSTPTGEPLELYLTLLRIRRIFEEIVTARPALSTAEAERLRGYYGGSWFKCPRLLCGRFYDGFASARERDDHEKRHSRPYRCDVPSCFASELGLASAQSLKKHKAEYHAGGEALFPMLRTGKVSRDRADLLFRLAKDGDISALKQHLDSDTITVTNGRRDTLLHIAARRGNIELAEALLSFAERARQPGMQSNHLGALINIENSHNITPLGCALYHVKECRRAMAKCLLRRGAIPWKQVALAPRTRGKHDLNFECVKLLLENGAGTPPSFPVTDDVTKFILGRQRLIDFPLCMSQLLRMAIRVGNEEISRLCLESGANPNELGPETAMDAEEYTPLIYAVFYGQLKVVEVLLKHPQLDVNATGRTGSTALHLAARLGHVQCVKALLAHSAIDVTIRDARGQTALDDAELKERTDVALEIEAFIATLGPRPTSTP